MQGIARRRDKTEVLVETLRPIVFRMHGEGTDPRDLRRLKCAQQRVLEKPGAKPLALKVRRNSEAGKQHDRHGVTGKPFGRAFWCATVLDLPEHKCVIADNLVFFSGQRNIGLRCSRLLALKCVFDQKTIQRITTAIKPVDIVMTL